MTSEFYRRVEQALQAVEDLDEGERRAEFERLRALALEDPEAGSSAVEAVDVVERWFTLQEPVPLRSQEMLADLLDPQDDPESIGPYEILRRMGEGPLAVIYEALEADREDCVAVKLLRPGLPSAEFVDVFRHELPALLICRHAHLARSLDVGQAEGGRAYLVQELVEGPGLERYCAQVRASLAERLELVAQVCDGMAYAHRRGHLHLGLSAQKVRVVRGGRKERGRACVLDLGVISALTRGRLSSSAAGSSPAPWAVSPEQVGFGNGALDVDLRADVYGVGAILYRLLTGCDPEGGGLGQDAQSESQTEGRPTSQRLRRLLAEPVPPSELLREVAAGTEPESLPLPVDARTIRTLERRLDTIVLRCLSLDRNRRHESMAALAAELRAVKPTGSFFAGFPRPRGWIPFGSATNA